MKKKILLVEDDLNTQKIVEFLLKDDYRVYAVSHGREAYHHLLTDLSFDLVLTDMEMPYMTGLELINKMNESLELSQIPVIILSSVDYEDLATSNEYSNVKSSLTKPVVPTDLYLKLEQAFSVLAY